MPTKPLPALCRVVVRRLIERHRWSLIDEANFSDRVLQRAQDAGTPAEEEPLRTLAVNLYCEIMYRACRSRGEQRERAYTELAHYLYNRAQYKYNDPEMAHAITHDAVILVSEQLDNCRKPGAFLAFAMLKLWNAATTYFRRRDRRRERTESFADRPEENVPARTTHPTPTPEAAVVDAAMAEAVLERVSEIGREAPRARNQLRAVVLKFLLGYADDEIADALETNVSNVYVLRSRGLKRLRNDPELRRLARQLLGDVT